MQKGPPDCADGQNPLIRSNRESLVPYFPPMSADMGISAGVPSWAFS